MTMEKQENQAFPFISTVEYGGNLAKSPLSTLTQKFISNDRFCTDHTIVLLNHNTSKYWKIFRNEELRIILAWYQVDL